MTDDDRPVVEQSEMLEMLAKAEREDWQHPMWGWLRALLAERDALQAELADTRKLLDPAVVAAAKSLERNADTHPDGCCSVCTEGLAERDALRQRVTELEADNATREEAAFVWAFQRAINSIDKYGDSDETAEEAFTVFRDERRTI